LSVRKRVTGWFMPRQARRFIAAAAFAASGFFLPILSPAGAAPIANCLTEAGPAGPKGSRWHYRLEWPSQRKCWHLVKNGTRLKTAAKTAPQAEPDDDTQATPAPAATVVPARAVVPESQPGPPPATTVKTFITRNVSNTDETPSTPDASATPRPQEQAPATATVERSESSAPPVLAAPSAPQPVAANAPANANDPVGAPTLRLLFAAIALLGFGAAAAFIVVAAMRRRTDVLKTALETDGAPDESPDAQPAEDAPTFAPLPPIGMGTDDIDQAIRRFARNAIRRAA